PNELPRLAIRPYPAEYVTSVTLRDGTPVTIRPIRPEDEPLMVAFHEGLSEESVRFRYFGFLSLSQRTGHEQLTRACFNDYDREIALVVDRVDKKGAHEILGVGRLIKAHHLDEAEFAIVIADAWQGLGLGRALLRLIIDVARQEKVGCVKGHILPDNAAMLQVSRKVGFVLRFEPEAGEWEAEFLLT
ncbi:MAG: GNAT family N-acetyltransferase, partial [Limisphaerales bacterium]